MLLDTWSFCCTVSDLQDMVNTLAGNFKTNSRTILMHLPYIQKLLCVYVSTAFYCNILLFVLSHNYCLIYVCHVDIVLFHFHHTVHSSFHSCTWSHHLFHNQQSLKRLIYYHHNLIQQSTMIAALVVIKTWPIVVNVIV